MNVAGVPQFRLPQRQKPIRAGGGADAAYAPSQAQPTAAAPRPNGQPQASSVMVTLMDDLTNLVKGFFSFLGNLFHVGNTTSPSAPIPAASPPAPAPAPVTAPTSNQAPVTAIAMPEGPLPAGVSAAVPTGQARAIASSFAGYNTDPYSDDWTNPNFLNAVAGQAPQNLRFPSGTFANFWNWQQGWMDGKQPDNSPDTLDKFKNAIEKTGATPVFVVNMLTKSLDDQLAMLRQAKALGLPITHVELGNELSLSDQASYAQKYPTAQDYMNAANQWTAAIKKEFPDAEVALTGSWLEGDPDPRMTRWNQTLAANVQGEDAVTEHVYPNAGLGGKTSIDQGDIPTVLAKAYSYWQHVQDTQLPTLPQNKQVWITEFNEGDEKTPVNGTWLNGLAVGAMATMFAADPRVALIDDHDLSGAGNFSAFFTTNQDFTYDKLAPSAPSPTTTPYAKSANGEAMGLFSEACKGMTEAQPLSFPGIPQEQAANGGTFPGVTGTIFSSAKGRQAYILNLSAQPRTISTSGLGAPGAIVKQVSSNPLTMVASPSDVKESTGALGGQLVLPPYSVTAVLLPNV